MNDSTLPPPRGTTSSSNTKTKTNSTSSRQRRTNNKAVVRKGFALHDWVQLQRCAKDLAQLKGAPIRRSISKKEIALHNNEFDAWISCHGKVYNVTPYLHYHPGGVSIMKGVLGKDASVLYDKYHRWVNLDGIVGSLLLGYLAKNEPESDDDDDSDDDDSDDETEEKMASGASGASVDNLQQKQTEFQFAVPQPRPPKKGNISSLLPPMGDEEEQY